MTGWSCYPILSLTPRKPRGRYFNQTVAAFFNNREFPFIEKGLLKISLYNYYITLLRTQYCVTAISVFPLRSYYSVRFAVVATFVTSHARRRRSDMFRSIFFVAMIAVLLYTSFADASPELMNKLVKQYRKNTMQRLPQHGDCTKGNIVQREEW